MISTGGSSTQTVYENSDGDIQSHSYALGKEIYRDNQIESKETLKEKEKIFKYISNLDISLNDQLYVILSSNFFHIYNNNEDNSALNEKLNIRKCERSNPNQFIEKFIHPLYSEIMKFKLKNHINLKIYVYDAQWAKGLAIKNSGIPIVDVGTSKCREWLHNKIDNLINYKGSAPSITSLTDPSKLHEFYKELDDYASNKKIKDINDVYIAEFQLLLIYQKFREWNERKTLYYATGGVRQFTYKNNVKIERDENGINFVTLYTLVNCEKHPLYNAFKYEKMIDESEHKYNNNNGYIYISFPMLELNRIINEYQMNIYPIVKIPPEYVNKYINEFKPKNIIYIKNLIDCIEYNKTVFAQYSLTLNDGFSQIIRDYFEKLFTLATNKEHKSQIDYQKFYAFVVAIMYNSCQWCVHNLQTIRDLGKYYVERFPYVIDEKEQNELNLCIQNGYYMYNVYDKNMYGLCSNIINESDDIKNALQKIYESINLRKYEIENHFKSLEKDLNISIDHAHWYKDINDTIQKIKRESQYIDGGEMKCFNNLKDIIRSRVTVTTKDKLYKIMKYFKKYSLYQIKSRLDRRRLPIIYIVYGINQNNNLPPIEFQLHYKERSKYIHDFYNFSRIDNFSEFYLWLNKNVILLKNKHPEFAISASKNYFK